MMTINYQMTDLDRALESKGAQFERWVESADSLEMWETIGYAVAGLLVGWMLIRMTGSLMHWASMSWKHVVLSPVYLLMVLAVVFAVWRIGETAGAIPETLLRLLDQAVGS